MTNKITFLRSVVALLFVLATTTLHADRIEVFQLKNRSASEVISIIKPVLPQDTGLSGQGYRLIVNGDDATLNQVRQLLRDLDRRPKRLMISLRRGVQKQSSGTSADASGTIRSGDARVSINGDHPPRVTLHETRRNVDNGAIQHINGLEGRQSFIQIGKLVPVGKSFYNFRGQRGGTIRYKSATSGFYVLPRLVGDYVNLQISQASVSLNRHGKQVFDTQHADTTIRAKLGEWAPLASISQSSVQSGSGILHSTRSRDSSELDLLIKVDIIPE